MNKEIYTGIIAPIRSLGCYEFITGDRDRFSRTGYALLTEVLQDHKMSVNIFDVKYAFTEYRSLKELSNNYLLKEDISRIWKDLHCEDVSKEEIDWNDEEFRQLVIEEIDYSNTIFARDEDLDIYIMPL